MKIETRVFDTLKKKIPPEATKTILYAGVGDTSYEMFFYSLFPENGYKQCFTLAEEGLLNENELDAAFSSIAEMIKGDRRYQPGKLNVFTYVIGETSIEMTTEYHDEKERIYKIKKDWESRFLS